MSANTDFNPMGCLSEHLSYFSENIASKNSIVDGDFDDIFNKDFDLVFDPELLLHGHCTSTVPSIPAPQQQQAAPMSMPAPAPAPVPTPVQSSYEAQPMPVTSAPYVPPVTPAVPSKSIVQLAPQYTQQPRTVIHKAAPAMVSPCSVTAVFDSIPAPAPKPKSSPRKRSYSMVESEPEPAPVTSAEDTSNLSFEEQEDLRRERNRHHAKRSRQRKRNYMNQLEDAVNDMRKENERLFDLLGLDSRKAKVDMAKEQERKAAVATDKFIAGLKQPRNRVLDNTTLAFLRELWK